MDKIIWNDGFSVHVPSLDQQHEELISLINNLIDYSDANVDSEVISDTLTRMTRYATDHFRDEEEYMLKSGYPEYEAHKELHKKYKKKTVSLCMDTMQHQETVPRELLEFLKNWWITHLLEIDRLYSPQESAVK